MTWMTESPNQQQKNINRESPQEVEPTKPIFEVADCITTSSRDALGPKKYSNVRLGTIN